MVAGPKVTSEAGKNMLEYFNIRDNKIKPPDVYLRENFDKMRLENVKETYINQLG